MDTIISEMERKSEWNCMPRNKNMGNVDTSKTLDPQVLMRSEQENELWLFISTHSRAYACISYINRVHACKKRELLHRSDYKVHNNRNILMRPIILLPFTKKIIAKIENI